MNGKVLIDSKYFDLIGKVTDWYIAFERDDPYELDIMKAVYGRWVQAIPPDCEKAKFCLSESQIGSLKNAVDTARVNYDACHLDRAHLQELFTYLENLYAEFRR